MSKFNIDKLTEISGFIGAALVDSESGMSLANTSTSKVNMDLAAAGNTEVVRAKRRVAAQLGTTESIEDILITLSHQYHIIRPLESNASLFLYVMLDREKANLAMARHELRSYEKTLNFS